MISFNDDDIELDPMHWDNSHIVLCAEDYDKVMEVLDGPPRTNEGLKRLFSRKMVFQNLEPDKPIKSVYEDVHNPEK